MLDNLNDQLTQAILNNLTDTFVDKCKKMLTVLYQYQHSIYKAQTLRGKKEDKDVTGALPDDVLSYVEWTVQVVDNAIHIAANLKQDFLEKLNDTQKSSLFMQFQNVKYRFAISW